MASEYSNVFAIVLGASEFPNYGPIRIHGGDAFKASAKKFTHCLGQLFGSNWLSSHTQFLDLFDSTDNPDDLIKKISSFLKTANGDEHHLMIFYVGHGGFIDPEEYYLVLRNTREHHERTSGLTIKALADVVRLEFSKGNLYLILDCCFGGAAVKSFQLGNLTPIINFANKKAFPRVGTSVFCASSKESVALSKGTKKLTQFSECFTEVLEQGIQGEGQLLTLRSIAQAVRSRGERFGYDQVYPGLHSPQQQGTDAADHQFIPNVAYKNGDYSFGTSSPHESGYTVIKFNGLRQWLKKSWIVWGLGIVFLCIVALIALQYGKPTKIPVNVPTVEGLAEDDKNPDDSNLGKPTKIPVNVPTIERLAEDEAKRKLESAGLQVGTQYVKSDEVEFGFVIRQQPDGGEPVFSGSTVEIRVSDGLTKDSVRKLMHEFQRLGYMTNVASNLSKNEMEDILNIQSDYGLSSEKLEILSLLQKLSSMVRIPRFTQNDYDDVEKELTEIGLTARRNIVSRDSFNYICAILEKTYVLKSTSPSMETIVEKGSVVTVKVHEKWSTKPDPDAIFPDCMNPVYESP